MAQWLQVLTIVVKLIGLVRTAYPIVKELADEIQKLRKEWSDDKKLSPADVMDNEDGAKLLAQRKAMNAVIGKTGCPKPLAKAAVELAVGIDKMKNRKMDNVLDSIEGGGA